MQKKLENALWKYSNIPASNDKSIWRCGSSWSWLFFRIFVGFSDNKNVSWLKKEIKNIILKIQLRLSQIQWVFWQILIKNTYLLRFWDIISTTDRHMSNSFAKEVFLAGFSFANIDTIVVFTSFRISTFFITLAFTLKKECEN